MKTRRRTKEKAIISLVGDLGLAAVDNSVLCLTGRDVATVQGPVASRQEETCEDDDKARLYTG